MSAAAEPWHCRQIKNGQNPIVVCRAEELLQIVDIYREALHWTIGDDEELGAAVDVWFAAVREMGA